MSAGRSGPPGTWRSAAWVALACIGVVVVGVLLGRLPRLLLWVYLGASAFAFAAYGTDKSAARRRGPRTSENGLLLLGLAGGWPGALVAQRVFRHKTRDTAFQMGFWISVVVNCGLLLWFLTPHGAQALHSALAALGR